MGIKNIVFDIGNVLIRWEPLASIDKASVELLNHLDKLNFSLYCITDNTMETVSVLKAKYDFFDKFTGILVSSEVGATKPDPIMYQSLMEQYNLLPKETVFIDDLLLNVQGAINMGWHGIVFTNANDCKIQLQQLGIDFEDN